jgi:hypothetical protein
LLLATLAASVSIQSSSLKVVVAIDAITDAPIVSSNV